jgi:hypothetical protein
LWISLVQFKPIDLFISRKDAGLSKGAKIWLGVMANFAALREFSP